MSRQPVLNSHRCISGLVRSRLPDFNCATALQWTAGMRPVEHRRGVSAFASHYLVLGSGKERDPRFARLMLRQRPVRRPR